MWIVNYIPAACRRSRVGAANKTVIWNLLQTSTVAAAGVRDLAATAPVIPEASYLINGLGTNLQYLSNSTTTPAGVTVLMERTVGEGGMMWEPAYVDIGTTDPEAGVRQCWGQIRDFFLRWPGDPQPGRMDLETSRRWRVVLANAATPPSSRTWICT